VLQEFEAPRISRKSSHESFRVGLLYPPGHLPGAHFLYRMSRHPGDTVTGRIKSMKNPHEPNGNPTHDLLIC
jgi:Cft2 family RNA processing exonuclease